MRAGEADMARHDYVTAAATLDNAHRSVPTSRKITIELAEADFGAGEPDAAMRLLRNMRLSPSEWQTLTQTMPAEYQKYFVPTGSGS
jgi:predicted Zn-dependent protease